MTTLKISLDSSFDKKKIAAVHAHRPIRVYDHKITEFAVRQACCDLLMKQRKHARHVLRPLLQLLRHWNIRPGVTQVAKALKKLMVSGEGNEEEGEAKACKSRVVYLLPLREALGRRACWGHRT
ncbi:hypothetical protein B0H17DRAFT_1135155 [Mycena rosella]|uniref:Uncharacterized protein n=1 Tax=Mycena rosella TaxID=1033263 RepID=A0AAD7DFZ0_MYCRO|nr:hypothetical protein B0H17DRAFT_1135155 [Mycena rosella]